MRIFVFVGTALIIAGLGQVLKITADAGQWCVWALFPPAAIALGYFVGDDYDRQHMRETWQKIVSLLRR